MSETTAPAVEGDFYDLAALLDEEDRLLLKRVRGFMEEHVAPVINVYWGKAEFPFEVLPAMAELGIAGLAYRGWGCPGRTDSGPPRGANPACTAVYYGKEARSRVV